MSTLDVRTDDAEPITEIVFAERNASGFTVAHQMTQHPADPSCVRIKDGTEFVLVVDAEHARNLIKALEAAIDIGWLK